MNSPAADIALARLLRLVSPMLPVGAFSYSQGLESAVEQGWAKGEAGVLEWIRGVVRYSIGTFEAPICCWLQRAWQADDTDSVKRWNATFLAAREAAELRSETVQMGYSLRRLIIDSNEFASHSVAVLESIDSPSYPVVYSFACAQWRIDERAALLGYVWSWVENQVVAAMKAVPLGQMAGQRLLAALTPDIAEVVNAALVADADDLSNAAPGLSIASCVHETQYSRLFRS